jgi:16S rRNA processing protein RimM
VRGTSFVREEQAVNEGAAHDWVVVGRVGRPHGIRGEVTVELRTDEPERRFADGATLATDGGPLTVDSTRWHQGRLLVRFAGTEGRDGAEALRDRELRVAIDPGEAPADPEEFYDHQLVGLEVVTVDGAEVGVLTRVDHHAAQDLLVIETATGEVLFPFVSAFVPEVDVAGGRIVLDDRPGLLRPDAWDA